MGTSWEEVWSELYMNCLLCLIAFIMLEEVQGPQTHSAGTTVVCQLLRWRSMWTTECSIASVVSRDLPLFCDNIAVQGGVGLVMVGVLFKGTYCNHFNLWSWALVWLNSLGLSILCVFAFSNTQSLAEVSGMSRWYHVASRCHICLCKNCTVLFLH